jgi:hypothetical protein
MKEKTLKEHMQAYHGALDDVRTYAKKIQAMLEGKLGNMPVHTTVRVGDLGSITYGVTVGVHPHADLVLVYSSAGYTAELVVHEGDVTVSIRMVNHVIREVGKVLADEGMGMPEKEAQDG